MKLSVICSESRLNALPELRTVLDGLFIESRAWYPRSDISHAANLDSLERTLDYSGYVLCAPGIDDFSSSWFHYVLGHQHGRTDRMSFWVRPEDARLVPDWAGRFIVISGDGRDVYEYYAEVEESWNEETRESLARSAINERNLEVSARAYIESVQKGDRFLMGLFLEAGFSPSLRDSSGVPVLNHAIRAGHVHLVTPLLDAGADLNGVAEDRGTTPIMDAAAGGLDELTVRLIGMGAELNHLSRDGQTAVTLAVGNGRDTSAIALIRGGADVDVADMLGMSARKYATLYNQEAILEVMRESDGSRGLTIGS